MIKAVIMIQIRKHEDETGQRYRWDEALYYVSGYYPDAKITDVLDVIDTLKAEKFLYY